MRVGEAGLSTRPKRYGEEGGVVVVRGCKNYKNHTALRSQTDRVIDRTTARSNAYDARDLCIGLGEGPRAAVCGDRALAIDSAMARCNHH